MARKRHPNLKLSSLRVDGVKGCAKCIIQDALMESQTQEECGGATYPLFNQEVLRTGTKLNRRIISSPRTGERKVGRSGHLDYLINFIWLSLEKTYSKLSEIGTAQISCETSWLNNLSSAQRAEGKHLKDRVVVGFQIEWDWDWDWDWERVLMSWAGKRNDSTRRKKGLTGDPTPGPSVFT